MNEALKQTFDLQESNLIILIYHDLQEFTRIYKNLQEFVKINLFVKL